MKIILGSSSPRRRELMDSMGLRYEVVKPDFEELLRKGEKPIEYALRNSRSKATYVDKHLLEERKACSSYLIVSADTIVVLGDRILEKPVSEEDAVNMLTMMAGQTHTVVTGMTVFGRMDDREPVIHSEAVLTNVTIKPLLMEEILFYVKTGEPLDKAGSYAIQGRGGYMVSRIDGSYSNVVGLPLTELSNVLERIFSYPLWKNV
ncbi:MAG: septum formation protein Maf [Oligoflexales bacterium]|nr:septum formation protein Maf [Oligoflexales bacterium]